MNNIMKLLKTYTKVDVTFAVIYSRNIFSVFDTRMYCIK